MSRGREPGAPPGFAPRDASELAGGEHVLDRSALSSLRGLERPGGPDPVRELCGMYLSDMSVRVASAARAADAGDWTELSRQAHAIKGAAGTFGANRMCVVARRLEDVAAPERARSVAAELAAELERVRSFIEGEILIAPAPRDRAGGGNSIVDQLNSTESR